MIKKDYMMSQNDMLKGPGGRTKMNSSMGLHINDKLNNNLPPVIKV